MPRLDLRTAGATGLVFLLALALRAYYVCEIWPHPAAQLPILDAEAYRRIALEIRAGDWIGDSVYYLDPLYPFFLAGLYAFVDPDTRGVLLAQALLDSLSVLLVMAIARRLFDARTALVAGLLAATYSLFFYYDGLLQKEALMTFLLCAALALILRAASADRPARWLPAGLLIGLAALTRGNSLLFAPVLVAWIALSGPGAPGRRLLSIALFSVGAAAAILPVTLRNYAVGDDLVLLNSQAGQNFYIGNARRNDTGVYLAPEFLRPNPEVEEVDFAAEARRRTGRDDLKPSEISNFWLREGLAEIAADPAHFVRHGARKLVVFANAYEIPDNSSIEYFRREVSDLLDLPFPGWAFVFPLALVGMTLARIRPLAHIPMLFVASYTAGILLFFNLSRMRMPVVPVSIVFAAFALVTIFDRVRARDLRALALPAAILLVAVPITQLDLPRQPLNVRYYNLGTAFVRRSEALWTEGLALEARSEEAEPTRRAARALFERAFEAQSHAERQFERGLELDPNYERLRGALRTALLARIAGLEKLEREPEALAAARALTTRFDRFPPGFLALGRLEERAGHPAEARTAYSRALRLAPDDPRARAGLDRVEAPLAPAPAND